MVLKRRFSRLLSGLGALILIVGITSQVFMPGKAFAASGTQSIEPRSLTLADSGANGGSEAGVPVNDDFDFTVDSTGVSDTIGSITFQWCTTAEAVSGLNCDAPAGVDVSAAALADDGGGITGFSTLTTSSNDDAGDGAVNTITIAQASAGVAVTSATALIKDFSGIVNTTSVNTTFYVRIYTYTDTTGGPLSNNNASVNDAGTVAASTANQLTISGNMPESLVFCTGQTIGLNAGDVPDCSTADVAAISFNQLFSPTSPSYATSQMAASTNATSGYAITVNGPTLTDGSNTITNMDSAGAAVVSEPGTSQFGMNLVEDDDPNSPGDGAPDVDPASANVTTPSGGTLYNGQAVAPFNAGGDIAAADYFFDPGTPTVVANSNGAGSDAQIFTTTYIVNVPGHQPAGEYTSTLTYICTPMF